MSNTITDHMINEVIQGKPVSVVVKENMKTAPKKFIPSQIVTGKCPNESCSYEKPEDTRGLVQITCSTCKKIVYKEAKKIDIKYKLLHLRPGHEFSFPETPDTTYVVKPADIGFIRFGDLQHNDNDITLSLEDSMKYPIILKSVVKEDERRFTFWEGDRVFDTDKCSKGVVLKKEGQGYTVRYDNGKTEWANPRNLDLIDKDQTTKSYITQEDDNKWVVKIAFDTRVFPSLRDALYMLKNRKMTLFRRFSKFLSENLDYIDIDQKALEFLKIADKRYWDSISLEDIQ